MEKLNELVELAKKATPGKWWIDSHGHSMVSFTDGDMEVVFVTKSDAMGEAKRHEGTGNLSHWRNDNDATFIAASNPQAILAIAEAFRALEQRAEAAEAKLEKQASDQKPFMYGIMTANGDAHFEDFCVSSDPGLLEDVIWEWNNGLADNEPKSQVVALYTHSTLK